MPKSPRLTADEADRLLLNNGFVLLRTKGSHHIYLKGKTRVVVPWHAGEALHPKIVRQIQKAISESA